MKMKKIKNWLLQNKSNIMIVSLTLLSCCLLFVSVVSGKMAYDKHQNQIKQNACLDAYKVMCVQAHACARYPVKACDELVQKAGFCSNVESLPIIEIMQACTEDLRHIECDSSVPGTCQTFMED